MLQLAMVMCAITTSLVYKNFRVYTYRNVLLLFEKRVKTKIKKPIEANFFFPNSFNPSGLNGRRNRLRIQFGVINSRRYRRIFSSPVEAKKK